MIDNISKKKVIFVDDEPKLLMGLKRMLRKKEKEWDMYFVESGEEALDTLNKMDFDVIVSDMRMPGMDGAQLLSKVMEKYPQVIRFILSGQSDKEVTIKSVGFTHQLLAKPCAAKDLINMLERACALRDYLSDPSLKSLVSQIDTLPSLPDIYLKIVEEVRSPNSSLEKIGEIISSDVSMTSKVLQLVNSAYFGPPKHILSPIEAAKYLGIDMLKGLVLTTNIFSSFKIKDVEQLSLSQLRDHSLFTGTLAKEIASNVSSDKIIADESFMSGVLHDVGRIVLAASLPDKYNEIPKLIEKEKINAQEAEKHIFKATHSQVGAYLLGLWGYPQVIVEAVLYHHNPSECNTIEFTPLTAVHVANAMDTCYGYAYDSLEIDNDHVAKVGMSGRIETWKKINKDLSKQSG
jgi:HD-like signal output (HDOD) protein